jgi:hypothetical protein
MRIARGTRGRPPKCGRSGQVVALTLREEVVAGVRAAARRHDRGGEPDARFWRCDRTRAHRVVSGAEYLVCNDEFVSREIDLIPVTFFCGRRAWPPGDDRRQGAAASPFFL